MGLLKDYLKYRVSALTRHDIHSPFIFDFIETVLRDKRKYEEYFQLGELERGLARNDEFIQLTDLGAGSRKPAKEKRVDEILSTSVQKPKYRELLFRIVRKYHSNSVVELGTNLGLSSAFIAEGLKSGGHLYTLEGDPELIKIAKAVLYQTPSGAQVEIIEGNFDDKLPELLVTLDKVDLAYIDGNHTYEATKRYFEMFLPKMASKGILIFDDIYWSEGMKQAWSEICAHPASQYTVDLFQLGIVFLDPVKVKQHFVLKY